MKNAFNNGTAGQEHVVLIAGELNFAARAAAFAYARKGNHIVVASGNDTAGLKLAEELRARDVDVAFMHAGDRAEIQTVVEKTVEHYGHLDVEYLQ